MRGCFRGGRRDAGAQDERVPELQLTVFIEKRFWGEDHRPDFFPESFFGP